MPRLLSILIAEDEKGVALALSYALKPMGHSVEIVSDGEQALSRLSQGPGAYDLLITDNNMPRMSGLELVRRLRNTAFSGTVLTLSAHLSPENRAAYRALGVDLLMDKPFDILEFRGIIEQISNGLAG